MASINLYRLDASKVKDCLQALSASRLELRNTKMINKEIDDNEYTFGIALYLEEPNFTDEEISWNWLLEEFGEKPFTTYKAPKAVLLIEKIYEDHVDTYAATFGSSYFKIDKYCDRDFGFNIASRLEFTNVKTTTLSSPNQKRNKTVYTYIDYNELDFDSGESYAKLKVNIKTPENFNLFKPGIEIGNSIRFTTDNETIDGVIDVLIYFEDILMHADVIHNIPLFQPVKDEELLLKLSDKFDKVLFDSLVEGKNISSLFVPELEIIGATEVFNWTDDEFSLKYIRSEDNKIFNLTIETVREFCVKNNINTIDNLKKVKIVRYRNGERIFSKPLIEVVEYTDDENKCLYSNGKWYLFNDDYLAYLDASMKEIEAFYHSQYDFNATIHNRFIEEMYELEKDNEYAGNTKDFSVEALRKRYYAEHCFNLIRQKEGTFICYDRENIAAGYEKMDLYEKNTATMFAVKKGKASSTLCYAVDQSLTALKMYKQDKTPDWPEIKNVGLWFILEIKTPLHTDEQNKVDLSSLNMLMLKNRLDHWKKEVRLAGFKPIVYINYRT